MFFKKIFVGFIALFMLCGFLFLDEESELKFRIIEVKRGDTLWKLARYNWKITAQINNVNPNNLRIGFLLIVASNWKLTKERFNRQAIVVEIEKRILKFYEDGKLIFEFSVGVGIKKTPTPIGKGIIYQKRKQPVFRYTTGPKAGEIIEYYKTKDGKVLKIPIENMRALGIFINNTNQYVIHSTVEEDSIGKAASAGCIRMKITDMLMLYPRIKRGAKVIIK